MDGRPGAAVGLLLLSDAVLLRLILRADDAQVWFFGRPIAWVCGVRQTFGVPCPTCGLTRSVVLSLHGELRAAWSLAPAGALIAAGLLGFGGALLAMGGLQWLGNSRVCAVTRLWLRRAAWIYGIVLVSAWICGWAVSLSAALRGI